LAVPSAHLVHLLPTFEVGAAQVRLARLAAAWADAYRHTVVTLDRRAAARDLVPPALDLGVIGPLRPRSSPAATRQLIGLLRPDLMIVDPSSLPLARFATWPRPGPPVILSVEGPKAIADAPMSRMLVRRLVGRLGAVVVPDPSLRDAVADELALPPDRVTVVADGAQLEDLPPARPVPGLRRRPGELVIGAFLCPDRRHRLDQLLQAFARAPHRATARLVIIGGSEDRRRLAAEAERLAVVDRVLLTGHIGDPVAALSEFDLFAIAPVGEGVPAGLLDAMARGMPIIGCGERSYTSLVGAPNRDFIVEPSNAAALTSKLDALLRSTQLRRHLGWVNRERAAERPFGRTAEAWRALIDRCLAERPR
jgi:glycosyltransferase involved in cell wall biosynthesis